MANEVELTDRQLEILHDHYKETFARLLKVESYRDRLFLWVIGLFALLSMEIGYPSAIGGTLGTFTIAGGEIDLRALPIPALLNASWVLTVALSLRYCQTTILASRQYTYLHTLEKVLSPQLGGGDIYQREGKVYLSEYPLLLNVAWFAYGILFPCIVILATSVLIIWEARELPYPIPNKLLDIILAIAVVFFFFAYRIQPAIFSRWNQLKSWRQGRNSRLKK